MGASTVSREQGLTRLRDAIVEHITFKIFGSLPIAGEVLQPINPRDTPLLTSDNNFIIVGYL